MPLSVSLLREKDLDDFVEVDDAAMKDYLFAQAMVGNLPDGLTRKELVRSEMQKNLKQSESTVWLKVNDTETEELIGGALWQFQFEPTKEIKSASQDMASNEEPQSFLETQSRRGEEFRARYIGTKPHAKLPILVTEPKHQHRGAGTMLVRWGCRNADEHGMLCALTASPAGWNMSLKNGFEVVEQYDLDLRQWGVNETTLRRAMIRPAKPK